MNCKTVVHFALVCHSYARGLHTKGLERVYNHRVGLGRDAKRRSIELKNTAVLWSTIPVASGESHTVVFAAKCSLAPVLVKLFLCRDFYYF